MNTTWTPASRTSVLHDLFGDVRFEGPHRLLAGRSCRPLRYSVASLELPGFLALVVLPHTPIELAGDAANGRLVADIRGAQPAAGQSAQVFARLDQQRRLPHAVHLHGRRHTGRCAAVDDDVGILCRQYSRATTGDVIAMLLDMLAPYRSPNGRRNERQGSDVQAARHVTCVMEQSPSVYSPMILTSTRLGRFPSNSP